ncbi:AMP-binding protein, partial [Candidatus Dojkabacteria bacterium]|nr:AMP-binding protein [Candidatus Dojkabacteria bacterium]
IQLGALSQYTHVPLVELQQRFPNSQFETLFVFENYPIANKSLQDRRFNISRGHGIERVEYPLTVVVVPGTELTIQFLYNESVFDCDSISTIIKAFNLILTDFEKYLDKPISSIPLIEHDESRLLIGIGANDDVYDCKEDLLDIFREVVKKNKKNIAVVDNHRSVNYQELDDMSTQLACYLQQQGVQAEEYVGVVLERSIDFIVSILAILKAGGAYVPIDIDDPKEKLRFVAHDTGLRFIITKEARREGIVIDGVECISIDKPNGHQQQQIRSTKASVAYIMYTSGSTGKPKGVVIQRSNVVRLARGLDVLRISSKDKIAHAANVAFDATTFEIWAILLNGGTVVVIPHSILLDPKQLKQILDKHTVSIMWMTYSLFKQILQSQPDILVKLNHLIIGG